MQRDQQAAMLKSFIIQRDVCNHISSSTWGGGWRHWELQASSRGLSLSHAKCNLLTKTYRKWVILLSQAFWCFSCDSCMTLAVFKQRFIISILFFLHFSIPTFLVITVSTAVIPNVHVCMYCYCPSIIIYMSYLSSFRLSSRWTQELTFSPLRGQTICTITSKWHWPLTLQHGSPWAIS